MDPVKQKGVVGLRNILYSLANLWKYKDSDNYVPATVTLHPYQVERESFEYLKESNPIWAKLFIKMSQDIEIIKALHHDSTDPMIKNLLKIVSKSSQKQFQKTKAIFFRNDFIYSDVQKNFHQTQINLIAPGAFTTSEKTQKFHQILNTINGNNWNLHYQPSIEKFISFLMKLLEQYAKQFPGSKPHILKIAEGNGGCGIQQAQIQKQLLLRGHVLVCGTFNDLINRIDYDENTGRVLVDGLEIGLVYYRNGYMNDHYPDQNSWKVRQILECSRAINLPNAKIQLVNFKSAQALVHTTDIARKYLEQEEIKVIEKLQAKIWSSEQVKENLEKIIEEYGKNIVVKSIHEGSEEKVFYQDTHEFLRKNDPKDYLVMQLIRSNTRPVLSLKMGKQLMKFSGVSEVGIFFYSIYKQKQVEDEGYITYLVKTIQEGVGEVITSYGNKAFDSLAFK